LQHDGLSAFQVVQLAANHFDAREATAIDLAE
jgi:hypothetical protein